MKEKNIKGRSNVEEQLFLGEMWVVHGVCDLCSLDLGKTSALAHWLTLVQLEDGRVEKADIYPSLHIKFNIP